MGVGGFGNSAGMRLVVVASRSILLISFNWSAFERVCLVSEALMNSEKGSSSCLFFGGVAPTLLQF